MQSICKIKLFNYTDTKMWAIPQLYFVNHKKEKTKQKNNAWSKTIEERHMHGFLWKKDVLLGVVAKETGTGSMQDNINSKWKLGKCIYVELYSN